MDQFGFGSEMDREIAAGAYNGLYWGKVTKNEDPLKMGRVKAFVAGVTRQETEWAYPIGMAGSGYNSKGGFFVPRVNALVLVGFIHGKLEEPFYFSAHYPQVKGTAATPNAVQGESAKETPNVRVLAETETFEIYVKDTATEQKIVLQTLGGSTMIEMDAKDGSIHLKALKSIIIEAPGVQIDGVGVTLKNRPVSALGLAI